MVPREPERLAKLFVQLPTLPEDSPASCPVGADEVAELVAEELDVPVREVELHFVRTAELDEVRYWVWRLDGDEAPVWVVVADDPDGEATLGCIVDRWGLTAEQAIAGDHFGVV